MNVIVVLKDRQLTVHCGNGQQNIQWLVNVALLRVDPEGRKLAAPPSAVALADGTQVGLHHAIVDKIQNGEQVFLIV